MKTGRIEKTWGAFQDEGSRDDVVKVFGPIIPITVGAQRVSNSAQPGAVATVVNKGGAAEALEHDPRVVVIAKATREFRENSLLKSLTTERAYINSELVHNKLGRVDDSEFSSIVRNGHGRSDRALVINKLREQFDAEPTLQRICESRVSFVNGSLLGKGLPGLSASERDGI